MRNAVPHTKTYLRYRDLLQLRMSASVGTIIGTVPGDSQPTTVHGMKVYITGTEIQFVW